MSDSLLCNFKPATTLQKLLRLSPSLESLGQALVGLQEDLECRIAILKPTSTFAPTYCKWLILLPVGNPRQRKSTKQPCAEQSPCSSDCYDSSHGMVQILESELWTGLIEWTIGLNFGLIYTKLAVLSVYVYLGQSIFVYADRSTINACSNAVTL